MKKNFYDFETYDLDPNYDECNVAMDMSEHEADCFAAERAQGVMIDNLVDDKDPERFLVVDWFDCYGIRRRYGNM